MDRMPDFSSYTYGELLDVRNQIDKTIYQDRFDEVARLIQIYEASPKEASPREAVEEEQKAITNKYATFWHRLGAAIIDGFVLAPILYLECLIFGVEFNLNDQLQQSLHGLQIIIYYIFMHAFYGQTVGKMCTGVKVVNHEDETPIGLNQSILRESVSLGFCLIGLLLIVVSLKVNIANIEPLIFTLLFIGILALGWNISEFITMLLNDKRRAVHDFIGRTVVVITND
ncbi:hypothetical protein BCU84_00290 [Shewanella sp. 10N.286.51.B7]|uniref:RDD family protein n=1 Tax=Shewanella sp. 10N.286.51.B7 TaxID=1880836 RepID=UPI000C8560C1|nr:RDD family protein [Shewanella sp. 10N.286.51.B7]PMG80930.1 hypothetical protein BCU84_00290 [Shewanella sp. 10N.286.51.B7]